MDYNEKTLKTEDIYKGNIIKVQNLTVSLPNGKEATRDIVLHPGASVVVPINEKGELYMVKQFRKPLDMTTLELPAGKLDFSGEDPKVCAERELMEETGLRAGKIEHLVSIHTTPGFCNEVIHMYAATELTQGDSCTDEDEFLDVEKIHVSKLVDMILNHEITDAKTIIGVMMAEKILSKK
ncbi:NUDIX hydrolase [Ruminiclostridium papyrosolvens DSM 2782]|uniref:NUDIX hydrolase n=1 Tax=Ruminiclostridium papyrosolvens DSM 2782 TaxID=588581 RepID=F1T9Y1_9FIRM|nr:NUDIX hydrolase [Ruminiclostridium papyrosolvens]EGD48723.1 NUDIX hydrolase [Ruminiclostridium papyrosolvens DSM 2782]WES32521.1 NUDIX hydrolase [Ruminiclostridium papyrosolvens DSM 2782]